MPVIVASGREVISRMNSFLSRYIERRARSWVVE